MKAVIIVLPNGNEKRYPLLPGAGVTENQTSKGLFLEFESEGEPVKFNLGVIAGYTQVNIPTP